MQTHSLLISSLLTLAVSVTSNVGLPPQQPETNPSTESSRILDEGNGAVRTPKLVKRVGGDLKASIEVDQGVYRYDKAMIESPLPVGYPEPTPPGAIDIKNYPSVRRAEWTSSDEGGDAMAAGFFPLFNHIKQRKIAMTAPVEMDFPNLYTDFMEDEPTEEDETKMSFLYREAKLGPAGKDGDIVIRDAPPVTVLSIGVKGGLDTTEKLNELRKWLKGQAEWEIDGDPRMFIYNGPFVDADWRWSEIQVPIRRTSKSTPVTSESSDTPVSSTDGAKKR